MIEHLPTDQHLRNAAQANRAMDLIDADWSMVRAYIDRLEFQKALDYFDKMGLDMEPSADLIKPAIIVRAEIVNAMRYFESTKKNQIM